jgi:hypothetical protein
VRSAALTLTTTLPLAPAKDGTELDKVVVPVLPGRIIIPGYRNYLEHVVGPAKACG